jgi:hypothetical protein
MFILGAVAGAVVTIILAAGAYFFLAPAAQQPQSAAPAAPLVQPLVQPAVPATADAGAAPAAPAASATVGAPPAPLLGAVTFCDPPSGTMNFRIATVRTLAGASAALASGSAKVAINGAPAVCSVPSGYSVVTCVASAASRPLAFPVTVDVLENGAPAQAPLSEDSSCALVDGGWSNWGKCKVTPTGNVQYRTCTNPRPAYGGAQCKGPTQQGCTP